MGIQGPGLCDSLDIDLHGCQDDFGEELVKGCQTLIQTAEKNELFFPYQVILIATCAF